MDREAFSKISESLRQYRRAELRDFERDIGSKPIDQLYVDPLPGDAVLQAVTSSNTTFLLGRKGTGKSTVFARAQSKFRDRRDIVSIYIDVKSLYDVLDATEIQAEELEAAGISNSAYRSHILRKTMLARIITELLKEIGETCDKLTLLERWRGVKKQYEELKTSLHTIAARVRNSKLQAHEIPILQTISNQIRLKKQTEVSAKTTIKGSASAKATIDSAELRAEVTGLLDEFDKTLDDSDVYNEYSDVILKSFPFSDIIAEIQTIITEAGLARLVVFFDDFSELKLVDQRLFVDVVLSPLNNSSNEAVKLKIAGYPGRVYYGKSIQARSTPSV